MAPCIRNCKNRKEIRTKINSSVTYHLFPKDPERKQKWIKVIGRRNLNPSQGAVVCSEHFEKNCFYTTGHAPKKLVEGATPSINLRKRWEGDAPQDTMWSPPPMDACNSRGDKSVKEDPRNTFHSSLLLNIPIITEEDTLKTKQFALQLQHLIIIYEKQKRKIKNLRQKYIRRKEIMRRQRDKNHRDGNIGNTEKCKNGIDSVNLDSDDDLTESVLSSDPL